MSEIDFFRHTVATLAYRSAKTMRDAPSDFADFKSSDTSNTPLRIVAHMGDLIEWGLTMVAGAPKWHSSTPTTWEAEKARFFAALERFDGELASGKPIRYDLTLMFQGPIADALTHTGQLAMLRRPFGAPMKGEAYVKAEIRLGRVGEEQAPIDPRFEFD